MAHNRIGQQLEPSTTEPQAPAIPAGFAFCPNPQATAANPSSFLHQAAYQQALQEARDRAWRAFLDRALFSVWN
ncbi:MAG TPA: hypothetical protein VGY55_24035 [Pirellulales bacterium]|jgi:hypothetical protein|nr:hypothetical protein [Pirellulales bacterium]